MPIIPNPVLIAYPTFQAPGGQTWRNVLYYTVTTPPTGSGPLSAAADAASAIFAAAYQPVIHASTTYLGCDVVWKSGATEFQARSGSGQGPGLLVTAALGQQNAWVIAKRTNNAGRSNLGRIFVSGMAVELLLVADPDEIDHTGPQIGAMQTLAGLLSADQTFGALGACHNRHWDRKTASLVPITEATVQGRVATRRDRRRHVADVAF